MTAAGRESAVAEAAKLRDHEWSVLRRGSAEQVEQVIARIATAISAALDSLPAHPDAVTDAYQKGRIQGPPDPDAPATPDDLGELARRRDALDAPPALGDDERAALAQVEHNVKVLLLQYDPITQAREKDAVGEALGIILTARAHQPTPPTQVDTARGLISEIIDLANQSRTDGESSMQLTIDDVYVLIALAGLGLDLATQATGAES